MEPRLMEQVNGKKKSFYLHVGSKRHSEMQDCCWSVAGDSVTADTDQADILHAFSASYFTKHAVLWLCT